MSRIQPIERRPQRLAKVARALKGVPPSARPTQERESSPLEVVARQHCAPLLEPTHRLLRGC